MYNDGASGRGYVLFWRLCVMCYGIESNMRTCRYGFSGDYASKYLSLFEIETFKYVKIFLNVNVTPRVEMIFKYQPDRLTYPAKSIISVSSLQPTSSQALNPQRCLMVGLP